MDNKNNFKYVCDYSHLIISAKGREKEREEFVAVFYVKEKLRLAPSTANLQMQDGGWTGEAKPPSWICMPRRIVGTKGRLVMTDKTIIMP